MEEYIPRTNEINICMKKVIIILITKICGLSPGSRGLPAPSKKKVKKNVCFSLGGGVFSLDLPFNG
jgi:hypothetical protein